MKINWAERLIVNNPVRVGIQRLIIRWIKSFARIAPGALILEIGCGRGAGAGLIQEEFHPALLHAFDLDQRMIRLARRYLRPKQQESILLYVGNALALPYRDSALDGIFGFGVLHHLPDWRGGLREVARVLKPGGLYCLEEYYPPLYQNFLTRRLLSHPADHRFYSRDLHRALKELGFAIVGRLEQKMLGILAVSEKKD